LQVGEEAIINFTNATSVPLRVGIVNPKSLFLIYVYISISNNFTIALWEMNSNGATGTGTGSVDAFIICQWEPTSIFAICNVASRVINFIYGRTGTDNISRLGIGCSTWTNLTTPWTSLGTVLFTVNNTGYILVRRLA
jgi:hypothetical protein